MERLEATIQNYEWGDPGFIPQLQGRSASGAPEAELWMGAHPSAPSRLVRSGVSLDEAIAVDPLGQLGGSVAAQFGRLPFLAKVIAAAGPLSIQTHPSLSQAASGFERESHAGVEIGDPARTYRDANHKPELVCALTAFEAKFGFRKLEATRELFASLGSGVSAISERLGQGGSAPEVLADVLGWLLRLEGPEVTTLVANTVETSRVSAGGPYAPDLAWSAGLQNSHPGDIGIVVALLLNHVVLEPGQALFLPAGNIHSYLTGAGVEVMANSDNVVRGGLTNKHIDVEELLSIAKFEPVEPAVQTPTSAVHTYQSPTPEFSLTRVRLDGHMPFEVTGPEILLVTEGVVQVTTASGEQASAQPGEPVWVPALDGSYTASGTGTLFRTTVPLSQLA